MKRIITSLTIAVVLLSSCVDNVYINGDLDGMWRVSRIEGPAGMAYPEDIYYSYQSHMCQIGKYFNDKNPILYLGNLYYNNDTIIMSDFRKYLEEDIICSQEHLNMFHIYSDSAVFKIEKLDDNVLVLIKGNAKYFLDKW